MLLAGARALAELRALAVPVSLTLPLHAPPRRPASCSAMAQGIKALPTFHAFRKGERVGVFVGSKINQLRSFVEQHAASA